MHKRYVIFFIIIMIQIILYNFGDKYNIISRMFLIDRINVKIMIACKCNIFTGYIPSLIMGISVLSRRFCKRGHNGVLKILAGRAPRSVSM